MDQLQKKSDEEKKDRRTVKEIIRRYRKTFATISKLELKNIDVQMEVYFGADVTCSIAIYDRDSCDNKGFYAYTFWSVEQINAVFDMVIDLAKKDDYAAVLEAYKIHIEPWHSVL